MRKLGACCQAVYIWGSVLRIHTAFNEACCMWSHSSNMPAFSLKRLEQPQAIFITPQEEITQTPVVFSTSVDLKGFVLESKEWIFVEILHWEEEQQLSEPVCPSVSCVAYLSLYSSWTTLKFIDASSEMLHKCLCKCLWLPHQQPQCLFQLMAFPGSQRRCPSVTVWEVGNLNEAVGVPKLQLHLRSLFLMFLSLLAANFIWSLRLNFGTSVETLVHFFYTLLLLPFGLVY